MATGETGERLNAPLRGKTLRSVCPLDEDAQGALSTAAEQFSLSRSRLESLLRVSRTIEDLEGCEGIETKHVDEAINYRSFARRYSREASEEKEEPNVMERLGGWWVGWYSGCGTAHEVECGEALNLTTGEKRDVAWLVPVESGEKRRRRAEWLNEN